MIDLDKWNALTALVREARSLDAAALKEMTEVTARWKVANQTLTDRMKVLDEYVASAKSQAISETGT